MSDLKRLQPKSQRLHTWKRALILGGVLIVGAGLCELFPTTGIRLYKDRLDSQFVLGQDEFGKREARLHSNGMLELSKRVFVPDQLESSDETALRLFNGPLKLPSGVQVSANAGAPSTQVLTAAPSTHLNSPLQISIVADAKEVFDPETGLFPNHAKRGRDWERRAWLTARDHEGIIYENPIGLRVHGGQSRKEAVKSLGLYFRKRYQGFSDSPEDIFFGEGTRGAEKIALINASKSTRFMAAMVTEMGEIIGCKVSKVRPARVFINGTEIPSPYFLFEHQSAEFLEDYYHVEEPVVHRLKSENPKIPFFTEWRNEVLRSDKKWDLKRLSKFFDVDDLCAWAFLISYTVTLDNNQGMYYYDATKPDDVWKCLTWDLDGCFNRVFSGAGSSKPEYFTDPFKMLSPLRGTMFHRLIEDSKEFFDYYENFCKKVMSEKLTKEVIFDLHDKYTQLAKEFPHKPHDLDWTLDKTREFLSTRHEFYIEYLKQQRIKLGHVKK